MSLARLPSNGLRYYGPTDKSSCSTPTAICTCLWSCAIQKRISPDLELQKKMSKTGHSHLNPEYASATLPTLPDPPAGYILFQRYAVCLPEDGPRLCLNLEEQKARFELRLDKTRSTFIYDVWCEDNAWIAGCKVSSSYHFRAGGYLRHSLLKLTQDHSIRHGLQHSNF